MTVYIAGGITGVEDYKARFAAAKRMLLRTGEDRPDSVARYYGSPRADKVLGPAERALDILGRTYCMDVCFAMINKADLVAFLPGWEQNRQASLEMQYCRYQSKPVYMIEQEEIEGWMTDEAG